MREPMLFGLGASRPLAQAIADCLGLPLAAHEEREFEDGEHKARPLQAVEGADVYVVHSLYGDPAQSANDKLCRLLFFLAAVRDHGAARVTAVAPYLCYARKDRRSRPQDPLATRYLAQMFEAFGVDAVLTLDVHNPAAFENAFRCRTGLLEAQVVFAERLAALVGTDPVCVLSPDSGGVKRADALRRLLVDRLGRPVGFGMMEKHRSAEGLSGETLFAEVEGRTVVIVDDMISTGATLARTAQAARAAGACRVYAMASHGLFVDAAAQIFADPQFDRVLVSDSVPPFRLQGHAAAARVETVGCAGLFADAIRRMNQGA
jgi:ribose-phosphate pyrophosphokinase